MCTLNDDDDDVQERTLQKRQNTVNSYMYLKYARVYVYLDAYMYMHTYVYLYKLINIDMSYLKSWPFLKRLLRREFFKIGKMQTIHLHI
jgi:hypothetical protein